MLKNPEIKIQILVSAAVGVTYMFFALIYSLWLVSHLDSLSNYPHHFIFTYIFETPLSYIEHVSFRTLELSDSLSTILFLLLLFFIPTFISFLVITILRFFTSHK